MLSPVSQKPMSHASGATGVELTYNVAQPRNEVVAALEKELLPLGWTHHAMKSSDSFRLTSKNNLVLVQDGTYFIKDGKEQISSSTDSAVVTFTGFASEPKTQ